jgi:hypothetical protein
VLIMYISMFLHMLMYKAIRKFMSLHPYIPVMRFGTMGTTSPRLDREEQGGLPRVGPLGLREWTRRPITEAV